MQLDLFQIEPLPRLEHPVMDINANEKLVEELAQALANNDEAAARVATVTIVGKVLNLFERHTVALENIAEALTTAQHRADCGFYIKTS